MDCTTFLQPDGRSQELLMMATCSTIQLYSMCTTNDRLNTRLTHTYHMPEAAGSDEVSSSEDRSFLPVWNHLQERIVGHTASDGAKLFVQRASPQTTAQT